jgi:hypothetical protein
MGLTVRVPSNPLPGTQNLFHEVTIARLYVVSCADHGLLHAFWRAHDYLRAMAPTRLLRHERGPAGRSGAGAVPAALTPRSTTSTSSPPTASASGAQMPIPVALDRALGPGAHSAGRRMPGAGLPGGGPPPRRYPFVLDSPHGTPAASPSKAHQPNRHTAAETDPITCRAMEASMLHHRGWARR